MRGLPVLLLVIAISLAGCAGGGHHSSPSAAASKGVAVPPAQVAAAPATASASGTPAPIRVLVPGMQDVGQFVVSASGPVRAENRAATTLLRLNQGDEIHLPTGVTWPQLPNAVAGLHWLNFTAHVSGHTLAVVGTTSSGHALSLVERLNDQTYRVHESADVLFWANEDGVFSESGSLADYPIAIDAAGHLWLAPLPVAPNSVIDEATGVGLDIRGMKRVGWLPSEDHKHGIGGFFFTICNPQRCNYTDRLAAPLTAPITGTLTCRVGADFDIIGDGFRLQFRYVDTAGRPRDPTPTPAADCGPGLAVKAGQEIEDTAAQYFVHAVSADGEPLSAVVSYDGTLYVGPLTVPPLDGPGRTD
jgi:hypothetical protein